LPSCPSCPPAFFPLFFRKLFFARLKRSDEGGKLLLWLSFFIRSWAFSSWRLSSSTRLSQGGHLFYLFPQGGSLLFLLPELRFLFDLPVSRQLLPLGTNDLLQTGYLLLEVSYEVFPSLLWEGLFLLFHSFHGFTLAFLLFPLQLVASTRGRFSCSSLAKLPLRLSSQVTRQV
jgi:hypothetical protein